MTAEFLQAKEKSFTKHWKQGVLKSGEGQNLLLHVIVLPIQFM